MSNIDLKDIQHKLYDRLKPSGWADRLKGFMLSDDFYQILKELLTQSQSGKRFTPVLKQMLRAFEECPFDELKVVMVAQHPHPKAGAADGIAFSCANIGTVESSLKYIFGELERTVDPNYVQNPDLKRWSNQGVLMLNTALTTQAGKPNTHDELWKPFMVYLFDVLQAHTGLVYVFIGDKSKEWRHSVNKQNYKFFTTHPSSAAYGTKQWNSGDLFNAINKVLKENDNTEIIW